MKFSLGFSPCPNDTFIFDALVNKKINTEGLEFEVFLEDVQTLNEWAIQGKLDITKISYGVLPKVLHHYQLLHSGGALGVGVGPLLISKEENKHIEPEDLTNSLVNKAIVAIPGENTTAHFLFSLAFPNATNKVFMRFDEVENFVLNPPDAFIKTGASIMGVIIHENRFTYQEKGLKKIIDLGDYWEQTTGNPVPLGGIIVKNNNPFSARVNSLIRKSVEYAFTYYPALPGYVKQHSQEMSETVMKQHIDLYVNNYTIDLGNEGKAAVKELLNVFSRVNNQPPYSRSNIFFDAEN